MMRLAKCLCVFGLPFFTAISVCRADSIITTLTKDGCTLQAEAYFNTSQWASSRYDLEIVPQPKAHYHWDFTLNHTSDVTPQHYTNIGNVQSRLPYGKAKSTVISVTLYQYDTLEERVTFHNLELKPLLVADKNNLVTPRFLLLQSPLTAITPSGITITLPAQDETFESLFSGYNGNADALFIKLSVTPSQPKVALPQSPLYQQYHTPLSIQLDCLSPDYMVFYQADNTYKTIAVGMPNLATVTHFDSLTLIIRQRVDLKSIPFAMKIPISRTSK